MDSNINPLSDLTNDELTNVENTSSADSELSVVPLTQQNLSNLFAVTNGPLAKLSSDLATLFTGINPSSLQVNGLTGGLVANQSSLQIIGDNIAIEATADSDPAQLLSDLQALGLQQVSAFGRVVSGLIPISELDKVAALSSLRLVRPAYEPITNNTDTPATNVGLVSSPSDEVVTNVGSVTSQGDVAQRSDIARSLYGVNGAGITIGVLSDSYNNLGGAATDVTSGDLPSGVIVLQDLASGGTDEGRAMLQIVADVAPGATLAFNTASVGGQAGFANGIVNLAKPVANGGAGASVIVDDVVYFAEPFFQDGIVTQAVDQVAATGVAYFSSASNQARRSYESPFVVGSTATVGGRSYTFQDFDPSGTVNNFQAITINGSFRAAFQWDQPFASASIGGAGSQSDLDLFLFAAPSFTSTIFASSTNNNLNADPFEFLGVTGTGTGYLAIGKRNAVGGPDPSIIKYIDFGSANNTFQFATNSSTSFGHNQSANGQGVAAAYYQQTPAFGVTPPVAESFTSLGGTPILFDTAGNRLATPVIRNQPAITAPDGVDTTFFGQDRDGNGKPNFSGTSAAAPSAAAAAALIRQAIPGVTNTQIYNALKNTALDMNTPGYDFLTGSGLIRVDAAIASLSTISIVKTTDGAESGTASVFTLTRTNTAAALNVSYSLGGTATVGSDYTDSGAGIATFAAGSATATITLPTIDDAVVDPNETIIATITAPTGYTISGSTNATATIANNDIGTLSIVKTTDGAETGPASSVFTLTRTGDLTAALNVSYSLGGTATVGSDYTDSGAGIATFAAGSATATITLPTIDDGVVDPNETITVTITPPTGYTISGSTIAIPNQTAQTINGVTSGETPTFSTNITKLNQSNTSSLSSVPIVSQDAISGAARNLSDDIKQSIERATILSSYSVEELSQTRQWAIGISGTQSPENLATLLGATNKGLTGFIPGTYVFEFSNTKSSQEIAQILKSKIGTTLDFFFPLVARQQQARFIPNDPLFSQQWHLNNTGQGGGTLGVDANIIPAWDVLDTLNTPIRGTGVTIAVVDDGLQISHPDISPGYQASLSYDFNSNDSDPTPSSTDGHGTSVGGVAAARGNNSIGVSGAAPGANLSGIRLTAAATTDQQEANALTYQSQGNYIYNNSWGPSDTGTSLASPGPLTLAALQTGVTTGRGGKGSIYTWAGGNGRANNDNSNYDGYANSRYVIAVAANRNDANGAFSSYSEPGANLLVTAPSNGGTLGIVTTDLTGADGYNGLADQNYTNNFGGTSSATPLVSGVVALMLQANPNLTWRDVQHILVRSAEKNDPTNSDWSVNSAGHDVNHNYGFGQIDALAAVNLAKTWVNVGPEISTTSGTQTVGAAIPDNNVTGISRTVNITQNLKVEAVEIVFDATHTYRGDLVISLTSPSGTVSRLAEDRNDSNDNYSSWKFTTKRDWDESSLGNWTLNVSDRFIQDVGTWNSWRLNIFGTNFTTGSNTATATIADNDIGTLSIVKTTDGAETGSVSSVFTLTRTGDLTAALNVNYSLGGTATVGSDYTNSGAGTATFAAGSATATITLPTIDDAVVDPNETIIATITAPTGYTISGSTSATATIADNDSLATSVTLAVGPNSVLEDGVPNLVYTFTRTGDTTNALSVNYIVGGTATFNTDYTQTGGQISTSTFTTPRGTITFAAGANTANLTINPTADTTIESNETVSLRLANGFGYNVGTATAVVGTIINDDFPSITLAVAPSSVTEDGTTNLVYTFTRTGITTSALSVSYKVGGTATFNADYTQTGAAAFSRTGGKITFAAGSATAILTIDPTADSIIESDETVALTLAPASNYIIGTTAPVTGTITNAVTPAPSINSLDNALSDGLFTSVLGADSISLFAAGQGLTDFALVTDDGFVANNARIVFNQGASSLSYNQNSNIFGEVGVFESARLGNADITLSSRDFSLVV
ncbi:S8 family serine peptidase [Anabaena lutea]|uniref:S8 family serine peptidase n=1 Tax=Anabaena lutea FACHB-196 TaxID=2692881 RepID=A0ABR8FF65_9NOST|nr:S8 family serine peptidase [Anabaena lutea]MBD2568872.1 S8 family serine peptidase [Anabaena lutea FACHB-196]